MAEKKSYSNTYNSIKMIWYVLRKYSSKQHPLSIREIHDHLTRIAGEMAPSYATLNRMIPRELDLLEMLYPGVAVEAGENVPLDVYPADDGLHIILETPEGEKLGEAEADIEVCSQPFKAPSYATVDNLLRDGAAFDMESFPFRLRCVAQTRNKLGRIKYIPYEEWEESLEEGKAENNNMPRRYYLANALTDAEWRIFSDLILVYPFITQAQTNKFLAVLNHLRPKKSVQRSVRYAYKRGSEQQFRVIEQLDEAISKKKKLRVVYGKYVLKQKNGSWQPELEQRSHNGLLEIEPYALMWSNGNYYLIAKGERMMNLRVDRIISAAITDESFALPDDFDPAEYRDRSPVMYPGKSSFVRLRCKTSMVNVLIDFFGSLPQYGAPEENDTVEVTMQVAPGGVKLLALQYADSVEVLEPAQLREDIEKTLASALEKYSRS